MKQIRQDRYPPPVILAIISDRANLSGVENANQTFIKWVEQDKIETLIWDLAADDVAVRGKIRASIVVSLARKFVFQLIRTFPRIFRANCLYIPLSQGGPALARDIMLLIFIKALRPKARLVVHLHGEYKIEYQTYRFCTKAAYWLTNQFASSFFGCIRTPPRFVTKDYSFILNPVRELFIERANTWSPNQQIFTYLYVGSVSPSKGCLNMLEEYFKNDSSGPTKLILCGYVHRKLSGYQTQFCSQEQWDEILNKAQQSGMVEFRGMQETGSVCALMQNSNVLLVPSFTEGMSTVLLESSMIGLPSISTDTGSAKWLSSLPSSRITIAEIQEFFEVAAGQSLPPFSRKNSFKDTYIGILETSRIEFTKILGS